MAGVLPSSVSLQSSLLYSSHENCAWSFKPFSCCSFTFNARKRSLVCFSSKKKNPGFFDMILDYIEGGPKLRKWYGAPDLNSKDGSILAEADESSGEDEVRDAVLVTDGDNEIGQMVILSLIVKRIRVKALVKDKRVALESFGTYVESMAGDLKDSSFLKKSLRGVRAIICPKEGFLSNVESLKGVQHVVILSQLSVYRSSKGVQTIISSNARRLAEQDETMVVASGIPYTIIRAGLLRDDRGGKQGFNFKEKQLQKAQKLSKIQSLVELEKEVRNVLDVLGLFSSSSYTEVLLQLKEKVLKRAELTEEDLVASLAFPCSHLSVTHNCNFSIP